MSAIRSHIAAAQSDPARNPFFLRRWSQPPMTPRQLEHAADLEQAHGNAARASLLSWRAHELRVGAEVASQ